MPESLVALVDDLMVASRIAEAAKPGAVPLTRVRTPEALLESCLASRPHLVILDLDADRLRPLAAIEALAQKPELAGVRVVGFVSHVDVERGRAARQAGCEVMSRGEFVRELPALVSPG